MKRFLNKLAIALLISACISPLATAQDTLKIDFQEAVTLALAKNLDYRILQNNQEVLKRDAQTAMAGHLPSANFNSSFMRQTGQQFQQIEDKIVVTKETNEIVSPSLGLNMPVFNSGRRILDTQSAMLAQKAGEKGLDRAKQLIVFDVARRYMQVLLDQELHRISSENLANQKNQLLQIEGFVEAGLRTLSDLYNQQAEVARVESLVLDAELTLQTDRWALAEYLQLEVGKIPVLAPVDETSFSDDLLGLSVDQLYDMAAKSRPDLQQQNLLVNSYKKDYQAIKAMMFPRLNAFYNYGTFYTSLDSRPMKSQLLDIYPQNTFGLSLNVPIFNALQSRLEVARSKMVHYNQGLRRDALDRKVYQEVVLAYQTYQVALRKSDNAAVRLKAATEAQQAVAERFRLGLSNFVDLSTANQALVNAQADQAQAAYTLYFQEVLMNYALGTLSY